MPGGKFGALAGAIVLGSLPSTSHGLPSTLFTYLECHGRAKTLDSTKSPQTSNKGIVQKYRFNSHDIQFLYESDPPVWISDCEIGVRCSIDDYGVYATSSDSTTDHTIKLMISRETGRWSVRTTDIQQQENAQAIRSSDISGSCWSIWNPIQPQF